MKTIEQKLQRVMEISLAFNLLKKEMYRDEFKYEWYFLEWIDNAVAFWMEFNEIVEDLDDQIDHATFFGVRK